MTVSTSTYTPVAPFTATVNNVLSQDYINTDNILINTDTQAPQVGTFCNPFKNGAVEAFVITDTTGDGGSDGTVQLCYLAQDPTAAQGWTLTPVVNAPSATPLSVIACMAGGSPNFFCLMSNGSIWQGWFFDGQINTTEYSLNVKWINETPSLKVAYYIPGQGTSASSPVPIVYLVLGSGQSGFVWTCMYNKPGGGWITTSYPSVTDVGPDATLPPFADENWFLVSAEAGTNALQSLWLIGGKLTSQTPYDSNSPLHPPQPATQPSYVCGAAWEGNNYGYRPIYVDTNGVPFLFDALYGSLVLPVNTPGDITMAQSVTNSDGLTTVFFVDDKENLSVLTETGSYSNTAKPPNYTAQWAPSVPIATGGSAGVNEGVTAIFPSYFPDDPPTLFTANADGALRLHQLNTGGWMNHTPALGQAQSYEVTTYNTLVHLMDANGAPVANAPLTVAASTVVGAVLNNAMQIIGPDAGQTSSITTNGAGVATIALMATDFAPPTLTIAYGADETWSVSPAGPVQAYFAGNSNGIENGGVSMSSNGALNGLASGSGQTFSADTIQNATNSTGQNLFPGVQGSNPVMQPADAYSAVQNVMAQSTTGTPEIAGFIINREVVAHRPSFQAFTDPDEFRAELAVHQQVITAALGGHIRHFFHSVWEGIKAGAMAVYHLAVDAVKGIASIVVKIGDALVSLGNYLIEGIEDVCHVVMAIFSAIEAVVKDVIDFLKAIFNMQHIVNTKNYFVSLVNKFPGWLDEQISNITNTINTGSWFKEQQPDVTNRLGNAAGGQNVSSSYNDFANNDSGRAVAPSGKPPSNTNMSGSNVSTAQVQSDPHAHWLLNKILGGAFDRPSVPDIKDVFAELDWASIEDAAEHFVTAMKSLAEDVGNTLKNNKKGPGAAFGDLSQPSLLHEISQNVLPELAEALDDIVIVALEFLQSVVHECFDDFFNAPLPSGLIRDLYGLVDKEDQNPTLLDLAALLCAFPTTIVYEIINGGDEPFPNDQAPAPDAALNAGADAAKVMATMAGLLQICYVLVDWWLDNTDDTNELPRAIYITSVAGPLVITALNWPTGGGNYELMPSDTIEAVAWSSNFAFPVINFTTLMMSWSRDTGTSEFAGDVSALFGAFAGIINLALATISNVENGANAAAIISGVFSPLGSLCAFLTLPAVKDASEGLSLVVKLVIDAIADIGGGACQIINAYKD